MRWVALLRAVNVGGTGKIEMARLRAAAERGGAGRSAQLYRRRQSGFLRPDDEDGVRRVLTEAITANLAGAPAC